MDTSGRVALRVAVIGALGVIGAALLGVFGTVSVPFINHFLSQRSPAQIKPSDETAIVSIPKGKRHEKNKTPRPAPSINGDNDFTNEQSNKSGQQVGPIRGDNNQVIQNSGSGAVTVNQLPPSSPHPVTFGMDLKWTLENFAEAVRNGNLAAIKEYLNPKDGFDPNSVWDSSFVLERAVWADTQNFSAILKLFKDTGKLNWNSVSRSVGSGSQKQSSTLQLTLIRGAASQNHSEQLKALVDAGADPSQVIADETRAFNTPASGDLLYKGELTGRSRDGAGARAEQELAAFKDIGYPLPNLQQAVADASRTGQACAQEIRSRHSLKELMELAKKPAEIPSSQALEWQSYQGVVSYLRKKLAFGPLQWQGDDMEYARAVDAACRPYSTPF